MIRKSFALAAVAVTAIIAAAPKSHAQQGQSIALILDASGSMNAKLASGRTRIEAAKAAVADFVTRLAPGTRVSYRVYGHQSPSRDHNCRDTELMVPFDAAGANRQDILAKTQTIKAQGYTPITYVIQLAAQDVGKEAGARTVVLVSDGKETCEGDPCAAAKALADADARLVIHTIGFNVDAAARFQLQCIAKVARGTYSDAGDAGDLAAKLSATARVQAPPATEIRTQVTITRTRPGSLQITPVTAEGHDVIDAATGRKLGSLSMFQSTMELPAGIYNVTFGNRVWKSVEVRGNGEKTVLNPGMIEVRHATLGGHAIIDFETEEEVAKVTALSSSATVIPSSYSIRFGNAVWPNIDVKPGERKIINPGVISVKGAGVNKFPIMAGDGAVVATVSAFESSAPLPPGTYTLDVGDQKVPVDLKEGQVLEINLK